jgi:hypothetical protein
MRSTSYRTGSAPRTLTASAKATARPPKLHAKAEACAPTSHPLYVTPRTLKRALYVAPLHHSAALEIT